MLDFYEINYPCSVGSPFCKTPSSLQEKNTQGVHYCHNGFLNVFLFSVCV
jgi:hypothetical protein